MEHISDVLKRVLNGLGKQQREKDESDNMSTMNVNNGDNSKGRKRLLDLTGSDFLKKKGLKRDKANLVTMLIRHRADLMALHRITNDGEVQRLMGTMVGKNVSERDYEFLESVEMKLNNYTYEMTSKQMRWLMDIERRVEHGTHK